jgi:PAS domain S-box-containing protein
MDRPFGRCDWRMGACRAARVVSVRGDYVQDRLGEEQNISSGLLQVRSRETSLNTTSEFGHKRAPRQWRTALILTALTVCSFATLMLWMFGSPLSSSSEIELDDLKSIDVGNRVHISGVVTFSDEERKFYYLQDHTAGIRIHADDAETMPRPGTRVSIRGVVTKAYNPTVGRRSVTLAETQIKRAREHDLPAAKLKALADLFSDTGAHEGIRVETSGIVHAARRDGNRMLLEIGDKGRRMPVSVIDDGTLTRESLLDTRISVRGVVQVEYNPWEETFAHNNDMGPLLQVAARADLDMLEHAPADIPLAPSVRALITEPQWVSLGHRVRIQGVVVRPETPQVLLIDNGGILMPVETPYSMQFKAGDSIEATGWPTPRRFTITLQRAEVKRIAAQELNLAADESQNGLPWMRSLEHIRQLPNTLASHAYPVDIKGVLTAVHHQRDCFFIQIGNEGIYVDASDQFLQKFRPGQLVRLRGVTWSGGFAPVIIHPKLELLGEGRMPVAQKVDPEVAPSGTYDSEWVEIEGLVRPIRRTDGGYLFNLMTSVGPVGALMVNANDESEWRSLIDARVRVRGVFATSFTNDRVLTGYRIFIDSPKSMDVLRAAPSAAESKPLERIADLLRFGGDGEQGRRARVQGIVTMRATDMLYIEDASGSLRIEISEPGVQIGNLVEATGYPSPSENGPILGDASVQPLGERVRIEPRLVTPEEVLSSDLDNRLIAVEARLLNLVSGATQQTLVLHDGYTTFNAILDNGVPLENLREGSMLRIVGICAVQRQRPLFRDFTSYPVSFRVLLRSSNDIEVLHVAPWWTLRHAWPALALLTLSICLAMLWVAALRRRVQTQTAEIETQRAFLRQIIDMCPNYIFVKDRAGRFTLVNRALAQAHGRKPEEMVGKTDQDVGSSEEEASAYHRDDLEVMNSNREKVIQVEPHTDGSGRQLWMHTVKRPLGNHDGAATHVLGVSNDVTLHKQVEATLQKARAAAEAANQAKSEFLANMSHEIRTPLNGILGMSELCLDTDLAREQREYIETVKLSADGLLNVINDILDFSKIEAGKLALDPAEFNIRETVDTALKTLALRAHQKNLELICDICGDVPDTAIGDANRLRQVLLNLVGNAIKFTERGEVVVRVCLVEDEAGQRILHFTVRDTGIGIAADRQQLIFNPFVQADTSTTRQYGGTGLGLTISTRLVTMMAGRIWLESEPAKGSEFHFTIKLAAAVHSQQLGAVGLERALKDVHVLVVDDNETNRRILHDALRRWGMRPLAAESATQALERLEQCVRSGDPVQLVLTDLSMPDIDGLALVERIRERAEISTTPIMMLTSSGHREDAARCRSLGVTSYLIKPVRLNELRDVFLRVLTQAEPVAAARPAPIVERGPGLNVLLAEDNPVNQLVMQRLLVKRGHRVTVAATGRVAVDALDHEAFDLVLMDVQMPEVDGFEATREIRRKEAGTGRRTPIVALTAHAMSGDRERCLESGMDGYMAKPINPKELDDTLKAFGTSAAGDARDGSASAQIAS